MIPINAVQSRPMHFSTCRVYYSEKHLNTIRHLSRRIRSIPGGAMANEVASQDTLLDCPATKTNAPHRSLQLPLCVQAPPGLPRNHQKGFHYSTGTTRLKNIDTRTVTENLGRPGSAEPVGSFSNIPKQEVGWSSPPSASASDSSNTSS